MDIQPPTFDLSELYQKRRTKDSARLRAYSKILEQIHHRIRTISRLPQSMSYTVYTIPPVILGLPRIDMEDCATFLVYTLRHEGFDVRFSYPNMLYIDWSKHERQYLLNESPIMQNMMISAERTQAEMERKELEASRLLAPRKSGRKVRIQDPGVHASRAVPPAPSSVGPSRSAMDVVLGRAPTAGSAPSASSYQPSPSFLQQLMNPSSAGKNQRVNSQTDYFK
jgi:hypothetical protein